MDREDVPCGYCSGTEHGGCRAVGQNGTAHRPTSRRDSGNICAWKLSDRIQRRGRCMLRPLQGRLGPRSLAGYAPHILSRYDRDTWTVPSAICASGWLSHGIRITTRADPSDRLDTVNDHPHRRSPARRSNHCEMPEDVLFLTVSPNVICNVSPIEMAADEGIQLHDSQIMRVHPGRTEQRRDGSSNTASGNKG